MSISSAIVKSRTKNRLKVIASSSQSSALKSTWLISLLFNEIKIDGALTSLKLCGIILLQSLISSINASILDWVPMDTAMDMVEATDTMKKIKNHNQKVNY